MQTLFRLSSDSLQTLFRLSSDSLQTLFRLSSDSIFALITLLVMAVCIPSGMAATVTWIGQGDTDDWSDVDNWQSGIAPQNGDTINFPVADAVSHNDMAGLQVQSISTDANFYANVTINGEAFELLGDITVGRSNNANRYFTINNSIVLAAGNHTVLHDTNAGVSRDYNFNGKLTGSGELTLSSTLSSGVKFNFNNSANDFTGDITVNNNASIVSFVEGGLGKGANIKVTGGNAASPTFAFIGNQDGVVDKDLQLNSMRTNTLTFANNSDDKDLAYTGDITSFTRPAGPTGAGTVTFKFTGTSEGVSTFAPKIIAPLNGTAGVLVDTAGTWVFTSNNHSYTGTTTVLAGTLHIDGNQSAATGDVTVAATGILGGIGIIGGSTIINGILAPGEGSESLTFAKDLTLKAASKYLYHNDNLTIVNGALNLEENWTLTLAGTNYTKDAGSSIVLFEFGTINDDFAPASISFADIPGFDTSGLTFGVDGNQYLLYGVIPEPSVAGLLLFTVGMTTLLLRKRSRS